MKKAQVSLEYLILTSFVLVVVIIIFALAMFNYDSNIKTAKAGESLDSLAKTADLVYAKGNGTALFATVNWPDGVQSIGILHKCMQGQNAESQDYLAGCPNSGTQSTACPCTTGQLNGCTSDYDCIKYSAIHLVMDNGTDFIYGSKAKLCLRYKSGSNWNCDASVPTIDDFPLSPVEMEVKVLWVTNGTNYFIALQGIPD